MKNTNDYQVEILQEFRKRKWLSLFGFIVVNGMEGDFVWTGKWFKWVEIEEQKVKERYTFFDDGWSYQWYWGEWKESWKFKRLL